MHGGERRRRRPDGNAEMFGALLRFYRERARQSLDSLGKTLGYSKSQVAMVERGERPPKGRFVPLADETLGADGALLVAAAKLKGGPDPYWFEDYRSEEGRATVLNSYQVQAIPGLLQTKSYAHAIFNAHRPAEDEELIEERLAYRLDRAKLFERKPVCVMSFIIEEQILRRPLGGNAALKETLLNVLDVGRLRHVDIQVMPTEVEEHAGLDGSMVLLDTADHTQVAYVEWQGGGRMITDAADLSMLHVRYGTMRTQALSTKASADLIHEVASNL
ncbi:helix-turn-helix transcriptional regulator [Streptomyces sp. NPDC049954]|uniref:helix-turn-helix domain-containing protein n=1 Tax=Streptomyces sp. NPDC049954 TaxID=3155779 RepID=UPI0034265F82